MRPLSEAAAWLVPDEYYMPVWIPVSRCRPGHDKMYIYSAAASLSCLCTAVCQYDADPVTAGRAGRLFCHRQLETGQTHRNSLSTSWKTVLRLASGSSIHCQFIISPH